MYGVDQQILLEKWIGSLPLPILVFVIFTACLQPLKKSGTSPGSRTFIPSPVVLVEAAHAAAALAKAVVQIFAHGYALASTWLQV